MLEVGVYPPSKSRVASVAGGGPRRRSVRREPYAEAGIEPRLEDLLGDPLTHMLMRRDGVSDSNLRQLIGAAKQRLLARCVT